MDNEYEWIGQALEDFYENRCNGFYDETREYKEDEDENED
jgi:hypothetical protein